MNRAAVQGRFRILVLLLSYFIVLVLPLFLLFFMIAAWPSVLADVDLAERPAGAMTGLQSEAHDGLQAGASGDGPILDISQIRGNFEQGWPASIFVVLKNNQTPPKVTDESGLNRADARSIRAGLTSIDDRIKILSGTQMAGLLHPGENVTLQFVAIAEGVPPGVYSFRLLLNYSWLALVTASNEDGAPNLVFGYDARTLDLPIQTEVAREQRIELSVPEEDPFSKMLSGKDETLKLVLTNCGEESALNLSLKARPVYPFLMVENNPRLLSIASKESAEMSLMTFTDENATPGYYALPCSIAYECMQEDGTKVMRGQEISVMVYVIRKGYSAWIYLGATAALSVLLAAGWWVRKKVLSGRRRGRVRIVKS
jgi:hypothetical protein